MARCTSICYIPQPIYSCNNSKMYDPKYMDIMTNLKIVAMIPRNGKIKRACNGGITLEPESFFTPIYRKIFADSRVTTVSDLLALFLDAFGYIRDNNESMYIVALLVEMKNSLVGLENLKGTYKTDGKVFAQLSLLIEQVKMNIEHH